MKLPFFKGRDLASGIELLDELDSGCATDPRNYLCDTLGRNGLAADYALRNGIQTLKALDAYRRRIRRRMFGKVLGLKPPQGSVHAEMQGIIPQKGCRIEKWLTQPWPTLLVPTVLYLPEEAGPWPLVLLETNQFPPGDGDLNYAGFARLRGAAVVADVDHLAAAVAPRPCLLLDPWNEKILPAKRVAARYFRLTRAAYAAQGHPGQFRVENLQIGKRHALAERAFAFLRSRSQAS